MLNNLMTTSNGLKNIKDVADNPKTHRLLSSNGQFLDIDYIIENDFNGHIFNVSVMGDSVHSVSLNEDNKILILPKHADNGENVLYPYIVWKVPSEIERGDRVVIPRLDNRTYIRKPHAFDVLSLFKNKLFRVDKREHAVEHTSDYFRFIGYYFGSGKVLPNYQSIMFNTDAQNSYCVSDMEKLIKKYLSFDNKDIRTLRGEKHTTIIAPFNSPKVQNFLYKYNANEFAHINASVINFFDLELATEFLKGFVWSQAQPNKQRTNKSDGNALIGYLPTNLFSDSASTLSFVQWILTHFEIYSILKENTNYSQTQWKTNEKRYYLKIMSYSIDAFSKLVEINANPELTNNPYPYTRAEKPLNDEKFIYIPITKFSHAGKKSSVNYDLYSEKEDITKDGILLNQLIVR